MVPLVTYLREVGAVPIGTTLLAPLGELLGQYRGGWFRSGAWQQ